MKKWMKDLYKIAIHSHTPFKNLVFDPHTNKIATNLTLKKPYDIPLQRWINNNAIDYKNNK